MAFGVPVKVTVALCPVQMVVLDAIETTGGGTIVIVALPDAGAAHAGLPEVVAPVTV